MYPIATINVGSSAPAGLTFSSIPQNFTHLQMRAFSRSTTATSGVNIPIQFNLDTGNNYAVHYLGGNGSGAFSGVVGTSYSAANGGWTAGYNDTSNVFGANIIDILDYTNTNKYKTVRSLSGVDTNGAGLTGLWSGLWMNTAAITTIAFSLGSIAQYSTFQLYGITTA
jgi:hypothetical protein